MVGFDYLNRFIRDPPGKITKIEQIYAILATWKVMGQIDFRDFYWQI